MNIQNLINYVNLLFQIQRQKCFDAIGKAVSVKITLVQCDSFFILFEFSISEI